MSTRRHVRQVRCSTGCGECGARWHRHTCTAEEHGAAAVRPFREPDGESTARTTSRTPSARAVRRAVFGRLLRAMASARSALALRSVPIRPLRGGSAGAASPVGATGLESHASSPLGPVRRPGAGWLGRVHSTKCHRTPAGRSLDSAVFFPRCARLSHRRARTAA